MSDILPLGVLDIEILQGHQRYEASSVLEFRGEDAAYRFLLGLLDTPRGVDRVRAALAALDPHVPLTHAGPTELVRRLAREVAAGRLAVAARTPRRLWEAPAGAAQQGGSSSSSSAAQAQASPAAAEEQASAPPPEQQQAEPTEAEAAEAATDAAAQAQTLQEAAATGTPFCEECEKAKKRAAAGGGAGGTAGASGGGAAQSAPAAGSGTAAQPGAAAA